MDLCKMYRCLILIIISQIYLNDAAYDMERVSQYKITMELLEPYEFSYANPNSIEFKKMEAHIEMEVDNFFINMNSTKVDFQLINVENQTISAKRKIKVESILLVFDVKDSWAVSMLAYSGFQNNINMKAKTLNIFVWEPVSATYMSKLILRTPLATSTLPQATRDEIIKLFESVMESVMDYEYKISYMYSRNYEKDAKTQETAVFVKIEILILVDDPKTTRSEIETELKKATNCLSMECSTAEVIKWETEVKKYRSAMVIEEKYDVEYANKNSILYVDTLAAFNKGYKEIIQKIDIYSDFTDLNSIMIKNLTSGARHEMMFISVLEVEHRSVIVDFSSKLEEEISKLNNSRFSGKKILPGSQIFTEIGAGEIEFTLEFRGNVTDQLDISWNSYHDQQADIKELLLTLFQQLPMEFQVDKRAITISRLNGPVENYEVSVDTIKIKSLSDVFQPLLDLLLKQETTGVFGSLTLYKGYQIKFEYKELDFRCEYGVGQLGHHSINCDPNNPSGNIYCPWDKCDDKQHCFNFEDERDCDVTPNHFFMCVSWNYVISPEQVCDGYPDCFYEEDEQNCPATCSTTDPVFICNNGMKICFEKTCNGLYDCVAGEDEDPSICKTDCPVGYIECEFLNGEEKCAGLYNNIYECKDGSDEKFCKSCPVGYIECEFLNGEEKCAGLCNNIYECKDGSDEKFCNNCPVGYIKCDLLTGEEKCARLCDNIYECKDGSDEEFCNV